MKFFVSSKIIDYRAIRSRMEFHTAILSELEESQITATKTRRVNVIDVTLRLKGTLISRRYFLPTNKEMIDYRNVPSLSLFLAFPLFRSC